MPRIETLNDSNIIGEFIRYFLRDHKAEVTVYMVGSIVEATISYEDFLPVRDVRRVIEERFDNVYIREITRTYSAHAQLMVMQEMIDADERIYIENADGTSVRPVRMCELISERMYNRKID